MHQDIGEIVFSEIELQARIGQLANQIASDYQGKDPILLGIMKGCTFFMTDLSRRLAHLNLIIDFMTVSSYGAGTVSSGYVQVLKDLDVEIAGRDVLILEDIVDTGNTLSHVVAMLQERGPASLRICTLLDKPSRRIRPINIDYAGFEIPDHFVVGYGLDYDQRYRTLPYIGILKPQVYMKVEGGANSELVTSS